jgi:putative component of toxin-antitoxin plasmid stabilization module
MGAFRLYCAEIDGVILLLGGSKKTQNKDISKAKKLMEGVRSGRTRVKVYE